MEMSCVGGGSASEELTELWRQLLPKFCDLQVCCVILHNND